MLTLPAPVPSIKTSMGYFNFKSRPTVHKVLWVKAVSIVALGACSSIILQGSDLKEGTFYIAYTAFVVSRAASFIVFSMIKDPFPESEGERGENFLMFCGETVAFRNLCMAAGAMVLFPTQSTLSWAMLAQSVLAAVEVAVTFYLVRFTLMYSLLSNLCMLILHRFSSVALCLPRQLILSRPWLFRLLPPLLLPWLSRRL
jgi:hypothetical protein